MPNIILVQKAIAGDNIPAADVNADGSVSNADVQTIIEGKQ
jgi:hypothetical protein